LGVGDGVSESKLGRADIVLVSKKAEMIMPIITPINIIVLALFFWSVICTFNPLSAQV
jgi:hypothetical protein